MAGAIAARMGVLAMQQEIVSVVLIMIASMTSIAEKLVTWALYACVLHLSFKSHVNWGRCANILMKKIGVKQRT